MKDEIIRYTDFDYEMQQMILRANKFGNIDVVYRYSDSILIKVPVDNNYTCYVLNFKENKVDELAKYFNPGDILFFCSDINVSPHFTLLSQKISLCKCINSIIYDKDVYELTINDDTDVKKFLEISKLKEDESNKKSEAALIVNELLNAWQKKGFDTVSHYYCIKSNNIIVGIIVIGEANMLPNKICVESIYISPMQRNKGFGRRLLLSSTIYSCFDVASCFFTASIIITNFEFDSTPSSTIVKLL